MDRAEFLRHELWGEIRARIQYWDESKESVSPPLLEARQRAKVVGKYILGLKVVGEASPGLFSAAMLDNARSQWSQATTSYDNDSNYPNMEASLDGVLDVVARWPAARSASSNARAVIELIATASEAADDAVAFHRAAREDAERELAKARTATGVFDARLEKLEATIQQQQARAAELTTDRQKEHVEELKALQASFDDWLEDRKSAYKNMTARRDEEQQAFIDRAQDYMAQIEKLREDVGNIVGATTSEQMSKSYKDEAQREFNLASVAYGVGVLLILGLAGFLIHAMSDLGPRSNATWQYMSLKLGVTAALATAATVAFNLGHKFLDSSRAHKRMSMELVAMIPFLADLEEDETGSLRVAKLGFFDRSFGQQPAVKSEHAASEDGEGLQRTISDLSRAVSDLAKRGT